MAENGYRAMAIDLPPMGYSERDPQGDYGRAASAARILAFVQAQEITPHVVAHSFGAGAAVEAVMQTPEAFASLTIVNGALPLDPEATALPRPLRPLWLRGTVVPATVTNPLASRSLLQAFLHCKDTATDAVLEVLAQPSHLDGVPEALAIWLPTLLVSPLDLPSVSSSAFGQLTLPVVFIWAQKTRQCRSPRATPSRTASPAPPWPFCPMWAISR